MKRSNSNFKNVIVDQIEKINNCVYKPKHGSSDGSALDSRPRGHGFESRWILCDRVSKSKPYCLLRHMSINKHGRVGPIHLGMYLPGPIAD